MIAGDQENYDTAIAHLDAALEYRRRLQHPRDVGWSAINAARWRFARGDGDAAIEPLIDEAIDAHTTVGMQAGVTLGWAFRGALATRAGQHTTALNHLYRALRDVEDLADPAIHCYVHTRLAEVLVRDGQLEQARQHAREADDHGLRHGADWYRIDALTTVADTYNPSQHPDEVWRALTMAVVIANKLGDPRENALRERLDALAETSQ